MLSDLSASQMMISVLLWDQSPLGVVKWTGNMISRTNHSKLLTYPCDASMVNIENDVQAVFWMQRDFFILSNNSPNQQWSRSSSYTASWMEK